MSKVGIVGSGFIGGVHYGSHSKLADSQVIAICDIDVEKAKKTVSGEASGGNLTVEKSKPVGFDPEKIEYYSDYDKMLKNKDIEVIDVCLPTYMHKEAVIKAAKAGKHVLCEKPMALDTKDCKEMMKAVKKAGVNFMVAHVIRFWPEYVALKELIDSKTLGKLLALNLQRHSPTPTWTWKNWILEAKNSGAAALDLHVHDTDYVLYLCGMPKAVSSVGVKGYATKGVDHLTTQFFYKNGPKVTAEGGWAYAPKYPFRMAFWALFEKGAAEFSSLNYPMIVTPYGKEPFKPKLLSSDGYTNEIAYFLKCVKEGKEPSIVTPKDARDSVELVLAEVKSVEKGKPVVL